MFCLLWCLCRALIKVYFFFNLVNKYKKCYRKPSVFIFTFGFHNNNIIITFVPQWPYFPSIVKINSPTNIATYLSKHEFAQLYRDPQIILISLACKLVVVPKPFNLAEPRTTGKKHSLLQVFIQFIISNILNSTPLFSN